MNENENQNPEGQAPEGQAPQAQAPQPQAVPGAQPADASAPTPEQAAPVGAPVEPVTPVIAHTEQGPVYFPRPDAQNVAGLPAFPVMGYPGAPQYAAAPYGAPQLGAPQYGAPQPMTVEQMAYYQQTGQQSGQGGQPPRRDRRAALRGRRGRVALVGGLTALALAVGFGAGGATFAANQSANSSNSASTALLDDPASGSTGTGSGSTGSGSGTTTSPYGSGNGYGYSYGNGYGNGGSSSGSSGTSGSSAVAATAAQTAGVVTIVSDLTYQNAQSAGTGIILTSDGLILTNNHVIEGSTSIQVTDETTGATYTATVVGTDKTNDIAVLQLEGASGLSTASLSSTAASTGDTVTAVGNAEGTGNLVAAAGSVTATDQTITTQSETGVSGETLDGLIQVDADIVSGDSGGPLLNEQGEVVGIDTAASSGSANITGFAIPISTALDIVTQIEAGQDTATIEIGYPGFLGVQVAQSSTGSRTGQSNTSGTGAVIAGVVAGTPGADAGLAAGDVVTAVNGTAITSGTQFSSVLGAMEPGEQVSLTWTTTAGTSQTATVTLVQGPAV
ncbi:trypsin-like peptidase domain-containing protein [Herbiconiux sp. 11R-BC]|uniref:S1C family serine protease n=1 Tax=Herbiconiux sp. 11R-BC TaxID=3111637 RepID=UPI003C03E662